MARQFVFGYGSLAAEPRFAPSRDVRDEGFVADLRGFDRGWGVAMDNRRDLPGYKYYTSSEGSRPAVFVAFLDIAASTESAVVNGLCRPVGAAALADLDQRERNYLRLDVSDRIDAGGARVWTYVGTPAARERLRSARRAGTAVIDAAYLRVVRSAFRALGRDELARCRRSLQPGELAVRELVRHEISSFWPGQPPR